MNGRVEVTGEDVSFDVPVVRDVVPQAGDFHLLLRDKEAGKPYETQRSWLYELLRSGK